MSQRIISFILAALIFGSAIVSAIFVFQSIRNEQKDSAAVSTSNTKATEEETNTPPKENQLEGTKLANFTPSTDRVATLKVEDLVVGEGEEVSATATVTAHYTGALVADGTIFQSSKDTGAPFTAPLSNLIAGWQTGIPGMKVGGVRRLTIPAAQAYGSRAQGNIPADSDLVFDIEMVSAKN